MKTTLKSLTVFATLMTLVVSGCGLQDGEENTPPSCGDACGGDTDGGTDTVPPADGGSDYVAPAPVVSSATCSLAFADDYISGSPCGDVKGNLPGANWDPAVAGIPIRDTNADGRLELAFTTLAAGNYALTYRDRECPGEEPRTAWGLYGDPEMLRSMSADARAWLYCNWYDAASGQIVQVTAPGCEIRISVDASCHISGNGNMRDFE